MLKKNYIILTILVFYSITSLASQDPKSIDAQAEQAIKTLEQSEKQIIDFTAHLKDQQDALERQQKAAELVSTALSTANEIKKNLDQITW